jgi:uncharacterized SAM-binding protein YcdF (DUF218 family)
MDRAWYSAPVPAAVQWIVSQPLLLVLIGMVLMSVFLARALRKSFASIPAESSKPPNLSDERAAVVRAVSLQLQQARVLQELPEPIRPRIVNRWLQRIYASAMVASHAADIRRDQAELQERLRRAFRDDSPFDRITSVDHAIFMSTVENMTSEIRRLQAQQLSRWDVATVVLQILGLVVTVVGATLAGIKLIVELLK